MSMQIFKSILYLCLSGCYNAKQLQYVYDLGVSLKQHYVVLCGPGYHDAPEKNRKITVC